MFDMVVADFADVIGWVNNEYLFDFLKQILLLWSLSAKAWVVVTGRRQPLRELVTRPRQMQRRPGEARPKIFKAKRHEKMRK